VPDVLIIGAGIIGCAAAEALASRGAQVDVVDARGIGEGATQASAGMLVPHSEGRHDPWLASLGARSLALHASLADRLEIAGKSPWFVRAGSLELALNEEEAAELRAGAADLAAKGVESAFIPGAEARALERHIAADCLGALHVPSHAYARASDLTAALWDASSRRGARFIRGAVQRIEPSSNGGIRVILPERELRAPAVVLAAGSWAGGLEIANVPRLPVRPIRGQLLQLAWSGAALSHIIGGSRCYTLMWHDGTMLAGATVEDVGFDDRATAGGVRQLVDALCELVPGASEAGFTRVRVGFRPATPDSRPIIGRSSRISGLVYAVGHYRNGVLLAPVTGELVAKAVSGEDDSAFELTSPQRFGEY
jgi:glycine oxidase